MSETADLCIHELHRSQCVLCTPVKQQYWDAKFESPCGQCHGMIVVGDRVKWSADGTKAVHARHGRA